MSCELGVTEVGLAEYPLLDVLRESIFGEFEHRSLSSFAEILEGQRDVLALIAYLEGNPIGFKVGCGSRPGVYHSRSGGVLKDYRRLGLGRRMQEWQHGFARSRGYKRVFFNTFNHFRGMMLFGLKSGFTPVGIEWRELGVMSICFSWELSGESSSPEFPLLDPAKLAWPRVEVDHRDRRAITSLVTAGFHIVGMRQDLAAGQFAVVAERITSANV